MEKNYTISIKNKQTIDLETNDINFSSIGNYVKKNNKYYITYNDYDEKSTNKSGLTILKVESPELVTITKIGEFQSKLILEKGKQHSCPYKTAFGCLILEIHTESISLDLKENAAKIYIKYLTNVNSTNKIINEIQIDVKENSLPCQTP